MASSSARSLAAASRSACKRVCSKACGLGMDSRLDGSAGLRVELDGPAASDEPAITLLGVLLFCSSLTYICFNNAWPIELNDRSRVVRVELCCSAVASAVAPESPILLFLISRVVRVELCCNGIANALAPESPMEMSLNRALERSSVVREELCCSAVANALAPESPILLL